MQIKQIYAALEIADHEVRLIVGEFFETRFNVLCVERVKTTGVSNRVIVNEQNVIAAIIKATTNASKTLGYRINRVLLTIPSVNVARHNKRINVFVEDGSHRVRLQHIQKGINDAIVYRPETDKELVNVGCIKYITNGITSRKMPLQEICDVLTLNVDLLYADKEIVYSYASCIEKAGLEILDICLDAYAQAQEAAVFEQTVDKYVVLVDLGRQNTTLSLFTHGKLVSCELLETGYGEWCSRLKDTYGLPVDIGYRLLQNGFAMNSDAISDRLVYIWNEHGEQKQLTERQLYEAVHESMEKWIETLNISCQPIVESGNVHYMITGEGAEIQPLEVLKTKLNAPAQIYVPQTIGARDCALVTCLGLFYSWREINTIRKDERVSCDLREMETVMVSAAHKSTHDESSFTKKLKNILLSEKEK
ncbi:MAG: cell division protein FtsA [Erysipelotrichaceae bacterium]|nr:cell division protein FtsA [Erysipelotrichaceae bacterium]